PMAVDARTHDMAPLAANRVWLTAMLTSLVAWALPALALWTLAASLKDGYDAVSAQLAYASSALSGGLLLAPGGVRVVGTTLIADLTAHGLSEPDAALIVLAIRLVTAGLATILGGMFVWQHVRTRTLDSEAHFDDIADVYDAQIPAAQRESLLAR